ncbi:MAG: DinB family protein [Ginsengibacter sp.]
MKKIFLLLMLPLLCSSFLFISYKEITQAERKFAIDHLNKTRTDLMDAVKGLSEAQLNFKADTNRWSVLECVKHITLASPGILGLMEGTLKIPNDSSLKASFSDEQFIMMIENRSQKAQAPEPFKPMHSSFKNLEETLKAFNEGRDNLITYVNTTNDDLRNHIAKLPFGNADAYQVILLISAHTNRHTQQINEVKADPNFPKQ